MEAMTYLERVIRDYCKMGPKFRATIVRQYHERTRNTVRQTAKDLNMAVGTVFNMVHWKERHKKEVAK